MGVSPSMSNAQSQQDVQSPAKQRPAELATVHEHQAAAVEVAEPQKQAQSLPSDGDYVVVDASEAVSAGKKSRRSLSGGSERGLQVNGAVSDSLKGGEKVGGGGVALELNGPAGGEEEALAEPSQCVVNGSAAKEPNDEEQEQKDGECSDLMEKKQDAALREADDCARREEAVTAPARVPSPAVHISGVDMVFPENEVPIELCPFSSDGSVEDPLLKPLPPRRHDITEKKEKKSLMETAASAPTTPAPVQVDTAPTTPASVTAEESVAQNGSNRAMGRRKRRKKLSYASSRKKEATETKQEENNVPALPPVASLEDKLSISVNVHAAENGSDADCSGCAPSSPVYPEVDASHLYPSTPEGAPWRWEDVDSYFDPLAQGDLDILVRWRKENANCIAANPTVWRGMSGVDSKRAVLEAMIADASDTTIDHVECPIRRGRRYRDVWEEKDFLAQQKRYSSLGENHPQAQVVKLKKKRKSAVDAECSLLESHRDLVYGYDDDLFQEFRTRLEDQVKACQTHSKPDTPCPPPERRQQNSNLKVDGSSTDATVPEVVFDEEVMPSFPTSQLHPASLGLWKLRKNQDPDFAIVHPASVNRNQTPARWKEEMKRHHQQQYELQLQQTDELADPSDGDDEGTGDSSRDRLRATISNNEVTGRLPTFGDCIEEDEISQALAASVSKLVALSMYNWRTAQRVYERARCNIQCSPILEGEAAAARELEDVYLQLCPTRGMNEELAAIPGTDEACRPRTTQINSVPHDMIAYSVRRDIADSCSLAVAASVEFAIGLHVGDVVDVLDRNGCWNYGEVVETYSEGKMEIAKFLLMRFSLWSEDTVEWIAASDGRLLPRGVADGTRPCSVGPTRAHRTRVRYDQSLARELERSFPQRQAKQATAASQMLAHRQHTAMTRPSNDQLKTPQKRKRKRPAKAAAVVSTN